MTLPFSEQSPSSRKQAIQSWLKDDQDQELKEYLSFLTEDEFSTAIKQSALNNSIKCFQVLSNHYSMSSSDLLFVWSQSASKGYREILNFLLDQPYPQNVLIHGTSSAILKEQTEISDLLFSKIKRPLGKENLKTLLRSLSASKDTIKLQEILKETPPDLIYGALTTASALKNFDAIQVLLQQPLEVIGFLPICNAIRLQDEKVLDALLPFFDAQKTIEDLEGRGYLKEVEWFKTRQIKQEIIQSTHPLSRSTFSMRTRF